jgi:hypothetical protein
MGSQTRSVLDLPSYRQLSLLRSLAAIRAEWLAASRCLAADRPNVQFHQASVAASGLPPNSQDLGYSVGVLHHVPDTARLLIRRLPPRPKQLVTDLIALTVYWPLCRLASLASARPWSSASLVPRSGRCVPPLGWWICAFRRGLLIGV